MAAMPSDPPSQTPVKRQLGPSLLTKEERLEQKIALAFGFMSFIPLLLIVWALVSFVLPRQQDGMTARSVHLLVLAIVVSIFVGYSILKRTAKAVIKLVHQTRTITKQQLGEDAVQIKEGEDEISELAKAFNRITGEFERKIEELESSRTMVKRLLSRIGHAIVSYEGIDNLLELIVENASMALEAQMGSLLLVNGQRQELEMKVAWPSAGGQVTGIPAMKLGEGVAGWVAQQGSSMRATSSPNAVGLMNGHAREGAVLCVPLHIRERTIGVLSVLREDATRPFGEEDEVLLSNIGSQVAVAIENYRLNLDVEHTYLETVMALALAVEAKEPYTAGHSKRVAFYAVKIAEAMSLDEETRKLVRHAGLLHDVGKIGIKDDILLKAGPLSPDEFRIMQQHSVIGEAIIKPLHSLSRVAEIVRCHHERYDGKGYPSGLQGEAIPFAARILVVADSYDAMMTDRPYRKRLSPEAVIDELKKCSGTQFDPAIVAVFLTLLNEKEQRLAHANA
ncbi:MAG: HD domain-containing protein [Candidatus Omnitrophica bacterium]|nr:HD domain-containing protein [Candidatus Omnitrophota bacterium]